MILAAGAMSWFITWWFVLPAWKRLRHQGHQHLGHAPGLRRPHPQSAAELRGGPLHANRPAEEGATSSDGAAEEPVPFTGPDAAGVTSLTAK